MKLFLVILFFIFSFWIMWGVKDVPVAYEAPLDLLRFILMMGWPIWVFLILGFPTERVYAYFVKHPAEKSVKEALRTGSRSTTSEFTAALKKTSELAKTPGAAWKSDVMTQKAETLRKRVEADKNGAMARRLEEERRLIEASIERDRQQQLAELERRYGKER